MLETQESVTATNVLGDTKFEDDKIPVIEQGAHVKVLIADDSAFMRMILKKILIRNGFTEIVEARNGLEAIEALKTDKPELVLLDIVMPELDGVEVLKRIKEIDANTDVVMLTAVGQKDMRNKCMKLGAMDYILKPFDQENVVEILHRLKQWRGPRARSEEINNVLTDLEKDAIREIGLIGAGNAATALSKIIGSPIDIELTYASLEPVIKLPNIIGHRETLAVGINLVISGDVKGSILIVFPEKNAHRLANLLMKRNLSTVKKLNNMDKSALKEVGNILAGSCLTAISNLLEIHLIEQLPTIAHSMIGSLIDNISIQIGRRAEQALILGLDMNTSSGSKINTFFFLLFPYDQAKIILRAIDART